MSDLSQPPPYPLRADPTVVVAQDADMTDAADRTDANGTTDNNLRPHDVLPAASDTNHRDKEEKQDEGKTEEVQVLSPQEAEREFRRKRRRQLYRLLKRHDASPSFLAVIQAEPKPMGKSGNDDLDDDLDDDDDDKIPPPIIVVDVDAYLGFKTATSPDGVVSSSSFPRIVPNAIPSAPSSSSDNRVLSRLRSSTTTTAQGKQQPTEVPSEGTLAMTTKTTTTTTTIMTTTPADEGWYEGSRLMAMPEDATFLSDMHVWIRQNLEYFSASPLDVQQSQMGRRMKAVRGKVGIRCIHCARALLPLIEEGNKKVSWPPGAVAYPSDFASVYTGVSQKTQLHFESSCPYLPQGSILATMIRENQGLNRQGSGIGKRKRMVQGVSGLMYYIISAQRIGLQEQGELGLRFTRDLNLEPLDFESVRIQVERDRPDLIPRQYLPKLSYAVPTPTSNTPHGTHHSTIVTSSFGGPEAVTSSSSATDPTPPPLDAATQAVLKKALEDADDPQNRLIRRSDKALVSDYMFLAISQMAICHASPQDFAARGKKTKSLRLGLAGFCCRHCQHENNSIFSCRSFSSAPDNLASAISNSFVLHIQKCPFTPPEIKAALAASKKIHSRQMARMVYGSQRKFFFEMWERMRAADEPAPETLEEGDNEGEEEDEGENDQNEGSEHADEEWNPDVEMADGKEDDSNSFHKGSSSSSPPRPSIVVSSTVVDSNRPNAVGVDFPMSSDPVVRAVLKAAEESWDPSTNDYLILPEDRYLVSDYVFLTMRQLKVAFPTPSDFRGNRRNNVLSRMPGLCCIHCSNDPSFNTPSGRSFPSAPDNMASALNSSFYNHMQHCPHLDPTIKHALTHLRKIHSQQCSSLTFGSQRRFFNKVYDKLKQIPMTNEQLASFDSIRPPKAESGGKRSINDPIILENQVFREYSFVEAGAFGIPFWTCLQCRMVPFEFRSVGAVHYVRPLVQHLKQHRLVCQRDGISLGWLNNAVRDLCAQYRKGDGDDKLHEAIRPLIEIVVGNDPDLTRLFLDCIAARGENHQTVQTTSETSGWWRRLPSTVNVPNLEAAFELFATKLELSSSRLRDHPKILRALEIMSPCLQVSFFSVADDAHPSDARDESDPKISGATTGRSSTSTTSSAENVPADNVAAVAAADTEKTVIAE